MGDFNLEEIKAAPAAARALAEVAERLRSPIGRVPAFSFSNRATLEREADNAICAFRAADAAIRDGTGEGGQ